MLHIRAETAYANAHFRVLERAEVAWHLEELEGVLQGDVEHRLIGTQRREAGLFLIGALAYLYHGTEAAYLNRNGLACGRVGAEHAFANLVLQAHLAGAGYLGVEHVVEPADFAFPASIAFGNEIEALLEVGGEIEVEHVGEIVGEEVIDYYSGIGGYEFAFIGVDHHGIGSGGHGSVLEREGSGPAFLAGAVAFHHVFALLDGGDGGSIG